MHLEDLLPLTSSRGFTADTKAIGNAFGLGLPAVIAGLYEQNPGTFLVICEDGAEALCLKDALFALMPKVDCRIFSDYETLPYDRLSPHQDIISSRLELLSTVTSMQEGIVIASLTAAISRLPPPSFIKSESLILKTGERRGLAAMKAELADLGYLQVQQVLEHGEFAVRGSILDLYPMGSKQPFRIDFFDDEVDSIRIFDTETQRSLQKVEKIFLLPGHEFPLDEKGISVFRSNYRNAFPGANLLNHTIYQTVSKGAIPAGIEYYLPMFFSSMSTLFDYLGSDFKIISVGNLKKLSEDFDVDAHKRAAELKGSQDNPALPVYSLFMSPQEFFGKIEAFKNIALFKNSIIADGHSRYDTDFKAVPDISYDHHQKDPAGKFIDFASDLINDGGRILITAGSEGRRQSLREIFPRSLVLSYGISPASSFEDFLNSKAKIMLSIAPFDEGLIVPRLKLAFLTENELLGYKGGRSNIRRRSHLSQDAVIQNLAQLHEGQIVVHIDHGIGRYRGLKTLMIGDIKGEFLSIEYQRGDMLNIPITALNKVARYSGSENPPLSRLGSDAWSKKKQKAAEKVRDVAAELLDLYARRALKQGESFTIDRRMLDEFATGFGYQETPDQQKAIASTLDDLSKPTPMDRLICGDVGFGKTEVALRAAFVVAAAGSQVAMLVPTTILAEQHYQNFKDRFAGTALNVEVLSRFKSAKQQKEALKALEEGKIDIIIGTHKLLSSEIKFKKLGLIIVDEEHRFGVRQKEKLKKIRAQVDLLTLTATPIPRTLNMAMEGMRELSVIATPPEHRLAVKTFVTEFSEHLTREAVMRELRRGGQVYYLHNDVATINQKAEALQKLLPEAKIGIGHGQMNERELQKVMRDFYHQRFNLLLCSTIIENGLDVPTANTIIIDRADLLGLAQLHQLRGRVGRSHHQAYAYLFTPPKTLLSKDAKLRLEAISSMEELGAGFVLATHDLEIRGAGELLGEEQSGQIESVGFTLYTEMLEHAVKALKEGREPSLAELTLNDCDIDLHIPCLFPDTYIADVSTRLSVYKRLSSCVSTDDFEDLKSEIIDRFGLLPKAAVNLFEISMLKKLATDLGIKKILGNEQGGIIELYENHKIDNGYIVKLITSCKHNEYRLSGQNSLRYNLPENEHQSRLSLLKQLLQAFASHSALGK